MEIDVSDELGKKVKNNFDEVNNPQSSTSGNDASVSYSELESNMSNVDGVSNVSSMTYIVDDLLTKYITNLHFDEPQQ